jgi:hypothetical protein
MVLRVCAAICGAAFRLFIFCNGQRGPGAKSQAGFNSPKRTNSVTSISSEL